MPVIRTDADRKADAKLSDDKADWYTAHKIALLKTKEERHQALEAAAMNEQSGLIDEDYYEHIKDRAAQIFMKRKRAAEALADKASTQYQQTFKPKAKQNTGRTGTVRRQPARSEAGRNVAALLDHLDQGVTA